MTGAKKAPRKSEKDELTNPQIKTPTPFKAGNVQTIKNIKKPAISTTPDLLNRKPMTQKRYESKRSIEFKEKEAEVSSNS